MCQQYEGRHDVHYIRREHDHVGEGLERVIGGCRRDDDLRSEDVDGDGQHVLHHAVERTGESEEALSVEVVVGQFVIGRVRLGVLVILGIEGADDPRTGESFAGGAVHSVGVFLDAPVPGDDVAEHEDLDDHYGRDAYGGDLGPFDASGRDLGERDVDHHRHLHYQLRRPRHRQLDLRDVVGGTGDQAVDVEPAHLLRRERLHLVELLPAEDLGELRRHICGYASRSYRTEHAADGEEDHPQSFVEYRLRIAPVVEQDGDLAHVSGDLQIRPHLERDEDCHHADEQPVGFLEEAEDGHGILFGYCIQSGMYILY